MNLTSNQIDAIHNARLDLCASKEQFENDAAWVNADNGVGELAIACRDSIIELEKAFPFLTEDNTDEHSSRA